MNGLKLAFVLCTASVIIAACQGETETEKCCKENDVPFICSGFCMAAENNGQTKGSVGAGTRQPGDPQTICSMYEEAITKCVEEHGLSKRKRSVEIEQDVQGYVRFNDKLCTSSTSSLYNTFDEAKEVCSSNPECKMFYDNCGEGSYYHLCNGVSAYKVDSDCGTVLYEKEVNARVKRGSGGTDAPCDADSDCLSRFCLQGYCI